MKKILLLGDSIRMGYDKYVRESLDGVAEVYYPDVNCRFAQFTLRCVHDWKKKYGWPEDIDLVHWNVGLHDVGEIYDDGPLSTPEHYAHTLERIDRRLRLLFPKAKLIFALTTAVREEGYKGVFRRHNAVIEEFNEVARAVLGKTDTVINDLYEHTKDIAPECCSDMTHYNTPAGASYMGGKVLSVICPMLGISPKEVRAEGFELEKYSASNIGM